MGELKLDRKMKRPSLKLMKKAARDHRFKCNQPKKPKMDMSSAAYRLFVLINGEVCNG